VDLHYFLPLNSVRENGCGAQQYGAQIEIAQCAVLGFSGEETLVCTYAKGRTQSRYGSQMVAIGSIDEPEYPHSVHAEPSRTIAVLLYGDLSPDAKLCVSPAVG